MPRRPACCLLVLLLCAAAPAAEEEPDTFPPPTPAETAEVLPADGQAWPKVTLILRTEPDEKIRGYAQRRGEDLVVKPSQRSSTEDTYPIADLAVLEIYKQSSRPASLMERALRDDDFATALAVMAKVRELVEMEKIPTWIRYLDLVARRGQERLDAMLVELARAGQDEDPSVFRAELGTFITAMEDSAIPDKARGIVEDAWLAHVARMTPEERTAWRETADGMDQRLKWDENAPQYLADARSAYAAGKWAEAARLFEKAIAAHAAWEEKDLLHLGEAQLESGDRERARRTFWRLSATLRKDPQHRDLFERAGITAPPLAPELLTLAYVGGTGDQCFNQVAFAADATITATASSGLTARFAADGTTLLGVEGDKNADCENKGDRNFAPRHVRTNPYDGSTWKVGYKQVHSILQQPYLYTPHGWSWWSWNHGDCEPRRLMADSRGIELWFPNPEHFVVWAWSDGGNSSIDRDPRDLDRGNAVTKGQYFGGGSKLMLGEQKTGEPLKGWNFAGRPRQIVMDDYGLFYIAGSPRSTKCQTWFGRERGEILICDATLEQLAKLTLGPVRIVDLAVRDNLLVAVGQVGRAAGKNKKGEPYPEISADVLETVNPIQQEPGGGGDAVIATVRLWKTLGD